jgi:hypothetical protein
LNANVLHRIAPSVLLVAVALVQIALAQISALTPWKGGGFGMFSTLDHGAYRGVDAVIDGPDRSETLAIPESLEEITARAAACPSDYLLRRLAEGIVARERRYQRPVTRVTLTAWRTEFESQRLTPGEQTVRTFVYTVPAGQPAGGR